MAEHGKKIENYVGGAGNVRMCDKPMARWGSRCVALMGDPKWERRRIIDPEYKSVLHVAEGWYVQVYLIAERDNHFIGARYIPLEELKTLDGKPYPVPERPADAKGPIRDPWFKSEKSEQEKQMITLGKEPVAANTLEPGANTLEPVHPNASPRMDLTIAFRAFAGRVFDIEYEKGTARKIEGSPPHEFWRTYQPSNVRDYPQNKYEGKDTGLMMYCAQTPGDVAVYVKGDGATFVLVADCEEGLMMVEVK